MGRARSGTGGRERGEKENGTERGITRDHDVWSNRGKKRVRERERKEGSEKLRSRFVPDFPYPFCSCKELVYFIKYRILWLIDSIEYGHFAATTIFEVHKIVNLKGNILRKRSRLLLVEYRNSRVT